MSLIPSEDWEGPERLVLPQNVREDMEKEAKLIVLSYLTKVEEMILAEIKKPHNASWRILTKVRTMANQIIKEVDNEREPS